MALTNRDNTGCWLFSAQEMPVVAFRSCVGDEEHMGSARTRREGHRMISSELRLGADAQVWNWQH
jgi:hypothetical protein